MKRQGKRHLCWVTALLVLLAHPGLFFFTERSAQASVVFETETIFEAEDGAIVSPWIVYSNDPGASGDYVTTPTGARQDPPVGGAELSYTFTAPAATTYNVWARVMTPGDGSNSFFVAFDDGSYESVSYAVYADWKWEKVKTRAFTAGTHEMKWKHRERTASLDRLLITADLNYIPQGRGENPTGGSFTTERIFEAENGIIRSPWTVHSDDPNASGLYLSTPSGSRQDPPVGEPELSYVITVPSDASYNVWARALTPGDGSNSFFVTFDDNAYQSVSLNVYADWKWEKVGTMTLTSGKHVMHWKHRERGGKLDRFVITSKLGYVPAGLGEDPSNNTPTWPNPYPAPPVVPPGEHPRLMVRSSDLPAIRANLEKGLLTAAWQRVQADAVRYATGTLPTPQAGATNFNTSIRKSVEANALLYLLEGNETNGRKAINMVKQFMESAVFPATVQDITRQMGQTIFLGAVVYDWCYDLLLPNERTEIIEHMVRIGTAMEIGFPPTKQGSVVGHGSEAQLMRDLVGAGIAVYDEEPTIYNIAAGRFFSQFVEPRNYHYASHTHHQGDSYGPYRFQWDMFATWLFDRMGAQNVFSADQQYVPYRWLYTRRPDGQLMRDGDTTSVTVPFQGYWMDPLGIMMTASYYDDPVLHSEFLRMLEQNKTVDDIWMIMFYNPDLAVQPDSTLPLTKYFAGPYGAMTARTGWSGGTLSNTVIADMKIGNMWFGNHQHLDAGQFQLYYKGGLAIDSGIYGGVNGQYNSEHDRNYNKKTIAHNTMLVYDPNEQFKYQSYFTANDGGQRHPNNGSEPGTLSYMLERDYKVADVLAHKIGPNETIPDFSYIKGNLTGAYSSKINDFKRSFVFLNLKDDTHPAALIVFDKVTAADPNFKKTWLLHSMEEPAIVGQTSTVRRTTEGYNGKLVNQTLLPADASIVKIGGAGHEFDINGTNYPQYLTGGQTTESGAWRVEVSPSSAAATDTFLNVMQVTDDLGGPEPLPVSAIESPKLVGVQIDDRAVLFAKDSAPVGSEAEFELTGTGTLRIAVTDLQPGYWAVQVNGSPATGQYEVKADEGVLYFTGGSGSYRLVHSATRTLPEPTPVTALPLPQSEKALAMTLDGRPLPFNNGGAQKNDNNAIIVPYAELFSQLSVHSAWSGSTLNAAKGFTTASFTLNSNQATVNGQNVTLAASPEIRSGIVYVPLEFAEKAGWVSVTVEKFFERVSLRTLNASFDYPVVSVTSDTYGQGAAAVIDGRGDTAWTGTGSPSWLRFDLGSSRYMDRIGLVWKDGEGRLYRYKLEGSLDGVSWTPLYEGESGGTAEEQVWIAFTKARYVRLSGYGYSSPSGHGNQTSIAEVRFYRAGLAVTGVQTSSDDGNVGGNTLDNNLGTRWSAEGSGQWITYDLGAVRKASGLGVAWHNGNTRKTYYSVALSVYGDQWTQVYNGESSGTTLDPERIAWPAAEARYVRLIGYGNSINMWNSPAEVFAFGHKSESGDIVISQLETGLTGGGAGLSVSGRLSVTRTETVTVSVYGASGPALASVTLTSDSNGAFSGSVALPPGADWLKAVVHGSAIRNPQTRVVRPVAP